MSPTNEEEERASLSPSGCCYFCHGVGNLVRCSGGCDRSFHIHCLKDATQLTQEVWKCPECSSSQLLPSDYHLKHRLKSWWISSFSRKEEIVCISIEGNSFHFLLSRSLEF